MLLQLTLLSSHHKLGRLWILCQDLMSHAELLIRDAKSSDDFLNNSLSRCILNFKRFLDSLLVPVPIVSLVVLTTLFNVVIFLLGLWLRSLGSSSFSWSSCGSYRSGS